MNLLVQAITLPPSFSVTPEAAGQRAAMVQRSQTVTEVTTAQEQTDAVAIGTELQRHIREVEETRKAITKPLDDAKARVMMVERDYLAPLKVEKDRLGRLVTGYQEKERERLAREEAARHAEFQRLEQLRIEAENKANRARKPENQLAHELKAHNASEAQEALIAHAMPTTQKAKGAATTERPRHKVIDPEQVYKTHPHLCEITVKASAVNACVTPKAGSTEMNPDTTSVPGLALFWETSTSFSRRAA